MLVTGQFFNNCRPLTPADEAFSDFLLAWREQRSWTDETHVAYWRVALAHWPRAGGQVPRSAARAYWISRWRRAGASDGAIANRLGVERDSLRRRGVDALAATIGGVRAAIRAPLIVVPELEEFPSAADCWRDPRFNDLTPEPVMRLSAELLRAVSPGVPGKPPLGPLEIEAGAAIATLRCNW